MAEVEIESAGVGEGRDWVGMWIVFLVLVSGASGFNLSSWDGLLSEFRRVEVSVDSRRSRPRQA